MRWQTIDFIIPKKARSRLGTPPVSLTAVHVHEPTPPPGCEVLEWLLLTTLPVDETSQALEVLDYYALRWRIEDWHRILK